MLDLVHEQLSDDDATPAREEAYFAGARIDDDELRDAAAEDEQRRAQARARHADATRSNLGLGHDIRAGLIQPTEAQLRAVRDILCRLLVRHYRELIAYGAGWTDPERQQPVGDTGRHEPRHVRRDHRRRARTRARRPRPAARRSRSSPRGWAPRSCSTPPASPAPRRSARSGWRASSRDALPGGDGALRASRLGVHAADALARARRRSTATRSSATSTTRRPSTSTRIARPRTSTSSTSTTSRRPKPPNSEYQPARPSFRQSIKALAGGRDSGPRRSPPFCPCGRSSTSDRSCPRRRCPARTVPSRPLNHSPEPSVRLRAGAGSSSSGASLVAKTGGASAAV